MIDPITIALALAGQFAPSIIKHFTNSETAGVVAGKVIDIAKTVTGREDPEQAMEVLREDPALAAQFKLAVLEAETDLEKAYLKDRQDARDRDVKLAEAGMWNRRADYMVLLDVIGLISCLAVLILVKPLPGEVVGLLSTIAGIFGLCLRDAHQFEFGSSRSSQSKDHTISNLAGPK